MITTSLTSGSHDAALHLNPVRRAGPLKVIAFCLAVSGVGCGDPETRVAEEADGRDSTSVLAPSQSLVDTAIAPAIAGEDGWNFRQEASVDLDGDGGAELVVLSARVELYRGEPAWDDGQPWQVYIEYPDRREYVYTQRLQLGTLEMRVAPAEGTDPAAVVLIEHLPERMRIAEVSYDADKGALRTGIVYERRLDAGGGSATPIPP